MKKRLFIAMMALALAFTTTGCGSSKSSMAADMSPQVSPEVPMEGMGMEEEMPEEEIETDEAFDEGMSDENGEAATAGQSTMSEKIIYTYNYSVQTRQFDQFMEMLTDRITTYGGYIESSQTNGNEELAMERYATMCIRIPADNMHQFLEMVEQNSNVTSSNCSSENVTLNYVDMQSHVKSLRVEQETLLALLEKAKTVEDIVSLQSRLTDIRYEIESYESQLRTYDNRINYSTLYIDINEVERTTNVATKLTYGEEIAQGLSDTFYDLGQEIRSFSIWFVVNLPYIIFWIAVAAIIYLIVRAVRRRIPGTDRKDKKRHGRKNKPDITEPGDRKENQ